MTVSKSKPSITFGLHWLLAILTTSTTLDPSTPATRRAIVHLFSAHVTATVCAECDMSVQCAEYGMSVQCAVCSYSMSVQCAVCSYSMSVQCAVCSMSIQSRHCSPILCSRHGDRPAANLVLLSGSKSSASPPDLSCAYSIHMSVQCAVCSMTIQYECAVCSVQCAVCSYSMSVQCAVCSMFIQYECTV
jgi:hypothetical protein